jgi:DNA-binding XRE family transcriptional regulator
LPYIEIIRQLPYKTTAVAVFLEFEMSVANFAGRLKELRVRAGLTQEMLAERAELSKSGIADLEQGRREPSWSTVVALAMALGATCQDFLQEPDAQEKAKPGRPRQATLKLDTKTLPTPEPNPNPATEKPTSRPVRDKKRRT